MKRYVLNRGTIDNANKSHDEKWLTSLMRTYYSDMFNYGKKFCLDEQLVKDCIQDVFTGLWKRRNTGNVLLNTKFYLLRAIKNAVLKALATDIRHKYINHLFCANDIRCETSVDNIIIEHEINRENAQRLQKLLTNLSEREQEAIYLKYFQMLSNEQIAVLMNINRQSVYNLLFCSIQKLRQYWQVQSASPFTQQNKVRTINFTFFPFTFAE